MATSVVSPVVSASPVVGASPVVAPTPITSADARKVTNVTSADARKVTRNLPTSPVVDETELKKRAKRFASIFAVEEEKQPELTHEEKKEISSAKYWDRVEQVGSLFDGLVNKEQRLKMVAMAGMELAKEGKQLPKGQDVRHWCVSYFAKKEKWGNIDYTSFTETECEATFLKLFKGSYEKLMNGGWEAIELAQPSDEIALPSWTAQEGEKPSKVKAGKFLDNPAIFMETYGHRPKKEKKEKTRNEKLASAGEKLGKEISAALMSGDSERFTDCTDAILGIFGQLTPHQFNAIQRYISIIGKKRSGTLEDIYNTCPIENNPN